MNQKPGMKAVLTSQAIQTLRVKESLMAENISYRFLALTPESTRGSGCVCPRPPDGQPADVQISEPEPVNILTAMGENERVLKNEHDPERKAIALAWHSTRKIGRASCRERV